jgi:uncharacterized protein (DUF885 family)
MTTTTDTGLDRLSADYWEAALAWEPIFATVVGDRRFDDRLGSRDADAIDRRRRWLDAFRPQVQAIDPAAIGPADRVTRSALLEQLAMDQAEVNAWLDEWSVDPLHGPHIVALDLPDLQPASTPEQAEAMVARWRGLGPWIDGFSENLRAAARSGRVAVRTPVTKVVAELQETLGTPDDALPLLQPARDDHPDWPAGAVERFRRELDAAVRESVRPALERYLATIEEEVLPRARPDERPGIGELPVGAATYASLIRAHTSVDLAAEEIHRIGLEETARIDSELADLGSRVLGATSLPAVLARLRSDPDLHFRTRDEIADTAERSLARAVDAIPASFGIRPRAECVVTRMQPHVEKHSTIAYYREPAVDGSRPGQYYINTSEPETRPRYEAEALAFHEAVPGHHLQVAIAQELEHVPDFRRHLGPTAYIEGWGLYTERLSDEMGLYTGDLDRLGVLSYDAWRACRLVVDTGMHALGWTRRQAIDFMLGHSALAENNIVNEVDRYIVWPGQALAYKIGQLEILRLRREAQERQAGDFDIRAFHDAVLGEGPLGLAALRAVVEERLPA